MDEGFGSRSFCRRPGTGARTGTLRLLLFGGAVAAVIGLWGQGALMYAVTAACLLPFLLLVKYHNRLFLRKDYQEKRLEVNRQELAALDQDTSAFDDGKEFALLLPFGKLFVRRVGFGVQREHFIAVKAVKFFGVRIEVGVAQNGFGRDGILLVVEPVLRAEVGNAALRRDARAAEKDDAGTV